MSLLKNLELLSETQKNDINKGIIEVNGKAMNRTALGVVDAIFTLYPNISFSELKELLPDSINPAAPKNYKSIFKPYSERLYGVVQPGTIRQECEALGLDINASHFTLPGETFKTSDGVEVLVSRSWESADTSTGENDLENLTKHVEKYGIKVTKLEKKTAFNKGEYHLEVLNPELVAFIQNPPKKAFPWWIVIVAILTVVVLIVVLMLK
jgi:hypothetical protein